MTTSRFEIGPGIDCEVEDTQDTLGVNITLKGTFRHGGSTHAEIETRLKQCFVELDVDMNLALGCNEEPEETVRPVRSLAEVRTLARTDHRYVTVIEAASFNIGGPGNGIDDCYDWLVANANEVSEEAVIDEVNDCLDLYWPTP